MASVDGIDNLPFPEQQRLPTASNVRPLTYDPESSVRPALAKLLAQFGLIQHTKEQNYRGLFATRQFSAGPSPIKAPILVLTFAQARLYFVKNLMYIL